MKIVKTGSILRVFPDDLETFDKIPVGNYKVSFNGMMGFYLETTDSFEESEKPYGKHPLKIEKAIKLYNSVDRSVGILLSGGKGMGKSMFARLLSSEFAERHQMPTIIVSIAIPGIAGFIESIKQECVILFDEFEKVFDSGENNGMRRNEEKSKEESQDKLLGLFDGISQTKHMYVVTVNDIKKVNQYMINRPGRFHYHLQFNYPSAEEIELYMKDKLNAKYHNQIALVQRFSNRFNLNYDSLRAIVFDLNLGYSFIETMEDLNISSSESDSVRYDVVIHHSNETVVRESAYVNLMSSQAAVEYYYNDNYVRIKFSPLEIEIPNRDSFVVTSDQFVIDESDDENEGKSALVEKLVFSRASLGSRYGKELRNLL